jgi:hypothetical protein
VSYSTRISLLFNPPFHPEACFLPDLSVHGSVEHFGYLSPSKILVHSELPSHTMSLYTPIFPPLSAPRRFISQSSVSSSLAESFHQPQASLSERLRDQHLALGSVPAIISPPSPTPETDIKRFDDLVEEIRDAVNAAQRQPSNGRWAHVHTLTQLSCSENYWRGFGRRDPSHAEDDMEYFLPETEKEFMEWETRQEARRRETKRRCEDMAERELEEQLAQGLNPRAHAEAYAKVTKWQADVVPTSQPFDAASKPKGSEPSPLELPVSKPGALGIPESKGKEKAVLPIVVSRFFAPPPHDKHPEHSAPERPVQGLYAPQAMEIFSDEAVVPLPAPEKPDGPRISQISEVRCPRSLFLCLTHLACRLFFPHHSTTLLRPRHLRRSQH